MLSEIEAQPRCCTKVTIFAVSGYVLFLIFVQIVLWSLQAMTHHLGVIRLLCNESQGCVKAAASLVCELTICDVDCWLLRVKSKLGFVTHSLPYMRHYAFLRQQKRLVLLTRINPRAKLLQLCILY